MTSHAPSGMTDPTSVATSTNNNNNNNNTATTSLSAQSPTTGATTTASFRQSATSNSNDDSLRSSTRSSANQKTLSFFRSMMGQRNQDYRDDIPAAYRDTTAAAGIGMGPAPGGDTEDALSSRGGGGGGGGGGGASTCGGGGGGGGASTGGSIRNGQEPGASSVSTNCNRFGCCQRPSSSQQQQQQQQAIQKESCCCGGGGGCCGDPQSFVRRAIRWCSWPAYLRRPFFYRVLNNIYYKTLIIVLTLILLFGAQIRFLVIPRRLDTVVDGVFMASFGLFWLDVLMRIDAEPNYFFWSFCGSSSSSDAAKTSNHNTNGNTTSNHAGAGISNHNNNNHNIGSNSNNHTNHNFGSNNNNNNGNNMAPSLAAQDSNGGNGDTANNNNSIANGADGGSTTHSRCQFGSFLFWCDVISTMTLLQEISFINKEYFGEERIFIQLDGFGFPISGLDSVNNASPVEAELVLLVAIGKTFRIARFIRSSTAIRVTSKINWYFFVNIFNPFWWCQQCCVYFRRRGSRYGIDDGEDGPSDAADNTNIGNNNTGNNNNGGGEGKSGSTSHPSNMLDNRHGNSESYEYRRPSWGGVGLSALAAVKANVKLEDYSAVEHNRGIRGLFARVFGRKREAPNQELLRHVAATRIQRFWRHFHAERLAFDEEFEGGSDHDVAWKGRTLNSSGTMGAGSGTAIEKPLRKRSFLMRYANSISRRDNSHSNREGIISEMDHSMNSLADIAKKKNESQVGSAMRELTGQRVAVGIILTLVLTVLFTYTENDATRPSTMIVLFNQTANPNFADKSLAAARSSAIPDLYKYTLNNGTVRHFSISEVDSTFDLRPREILRISVQNQNNTSRTEGLFAFRNERREQALVSFLSTIFILLVWFFGVTAFAGPVMILVVIPIERMVRLLGMLMVNPLGYQDTLEYKKFVAEEDEITKNTRWTKEVLKGMETSFLMSTILRIGSLMKVGFGSAGVEIIRDNLEKGQEKNMLMLSNQGSTVSCIFLFCDIRQFTDATECLQEEVFVFTNRIAAVVHSICHSYGGSANKNVGDAFLLSWLLEDEAPGAARAFQDARSGENFTAKNNQADKALLSVVRISMALHYDQHYIETMSDTARDSLLAKLSRRKGPVVQMGFGLHAGKAVQGAIGSQRKIDATYVSEAVERAEYLESSTKKYGLKMLMSDSFHRLLHPGNRRRCRKIDQILIKDDEDESDEGYLDGDTMELLTFDMDIDALWKEGNKKSKNSDSIRESDSDIGSDKGSKRDGMSSARMVSSRIIKKGPRRRSTRHIHHLRDQGSDELSEVFGAGTPTASHGDGGDTEVVGPPELILPTGPVLYNANVWVNPEMKIIRSVFSDGLFFQKFNSGLQSFYAKDWEHAKQCFQSILDRKDEMGFEDGPSLYFLNEIKAHNGRPPRDFVGYGTA